MPFQPFLQKAFKTIRPWILYLGIFLLLRFTGLLAGISDVTNRAILKTGLMNAGTEKEVEAKRFDYNFSLYNLAQEKTQGTDFQGKTIFINLWATWCGPCRAEMPSIESLYKKVDKNKVAFIMLSLDQKDPLAKVGNYVNEKQFSFPVYFPASELPALLKVSSIPTTFVVDPEGKVVYKETGTANYDTEKFKNFLEGL